MRNITASVVLAPAIMASATYAEPCYVTSAAQLHEALLQFPLCTDIVIPDYNVLGEPIVIEIPYTFDGVRHDWISIGDVHRNLHLTINGTIKWVGPIASAGDTRKLIQISDATGIRIDGHGRFTSIYQYSTLNHAKSEHVAAAIRVLAATDLQIVGDDHAASPGLHFDNIDTMVLGEGPIFGGLLQNLRGTDLVYYGVYLQSSRDLTIENCHIGSPIGAIGTHERHGFRFYRSNNLRVINCSAFGISNYAIWPVTGNGVLIDGFETDHYCNIGPNTCPDGGETEALYNVRIKNLHINGNFIRVEQGTWHCTFEDSSASALMIGREPNDPALACFHLPRLIGRVHWRNFTCGQIAIANNPQVGNDIGPLCAGDVNGDGHVNVADLLAVVSHWGQCIAPYDANTCGLVAVDPCAADVGPAIAGDNVVDVQDLLTVIGAWGVCPLAANASPSDQG